MQLTQIPEEKNKIALLDEYFKNFGDVSNIKVRHNNRSDCALVTFTDANCAAAAMSNPAAILGNRFIRVHDLTLQRYFNLLFADDLVRSTERRETA